jgi:hypothetical protein
VKRLQCWNHKINSVKVWLKKHGATSQEIPVYVGYVRELLNQDSHSAYVNKLEEFKQKWSKSFIEYYNESLHAEVCHFL